MTYIHNKVKLTLTATVLLGSLEASAKNGFIPHYVGTEGILAGAGTALPLDCTSTIANPAALAVLPNHFIIMGGFLNQKQSIDSSAAPGGNPAGKLKNKTKYVPTITGGFNYRFNDKWAIGYAVTGGGGFVKLQDSFINPLALSPPKGGFNKEAVNSVLLSALTLAVRPCKPQSYGISLLIASSTFHTDLALPPVPFHEVSGHNKKNTKFGLGVRVGGLWDVHKYLTLGASAATPVYFARHNKYKELFQHKMQIPATARLGTTWHLNPCTDFVFDLKWLFYGKCKWLTDTLKWHTQTIFLTGIQHWVTKCFAVGVGYNYSRTPIRKKAVFVNSLSIPIDEHNIGGGFRYKTSEKSEWILSLYYIPHKKIKDNGLLQPAGKNTIMRSKSAGFEIGYRYNF